MSKLTDRFHNKTILVIGDVMLDEFIFGNITHKSPEAPTTPVILVSNKDYRLGGASNVANNIKSLGGKAILLGCIGKDSNGSKFSELLKGQNIQNVCFVSKDRPTTTKSRVFDDGRQVARVDTEKTHPLTPSELRAFVKILDKLPKNIDFVVISDYAKGVLSKRTMDILRNKFGGDKIIADPKPVHKDLMHDICAITPNLKETSTMAGMKLRKHADIKRIAMELTQKLNTSVITTMGREGMMVCQKDGLIVHRIRLPKKVKAIDVTGAGDVATAAFALALASKTSLLEAAKFANKAASLSVTKSGTATVTVKEVERHFR